MIVADSNLIAYLLIPGDKTSYSEAVLKQDAEWAAPLLWRSEFRNVLTLYMRHQGMTLAQALQTMDKAEALLRRNEFVVPSDSIFELTSQHPISAYDAEFVALATQLGVSLVTFDRTLVTMFPRTAVHPDRLR